jgi:hypothetical protein
VLRAGGNKHFKGVVNVAFFSESRGLTVFIKNQNILVANNDISENYDRKYMDTFRCEAVHAIGESI